MESELSIPGEQKSESDDAVRRLGPDRRKPSLRSIYFGMFNPRRRRIRRDEDEVNAFLDWHPNRLFVAAVAILLLSVVDGLLTVRLVSAGAQEINPLLAIFVHTNAAGFALVKWFLTALGVLAMVAAAHARIFGKIRGEVVLYGVLLGYSILVLYSLGLTVALPR